MSKLLLDLAEELDADEDVFVSLLLLDLASEEEGLTEELDSLAFSVDELDFLEPLEDEDWGSPLEAGMTEDEDSSAGSGDTEDDESSPHATNMLKKAKIKTLLKIFTEDLQI